jgi:hypothetical protein
MVLQSDAPVPLWGTAAAGEKITVSFRGQQKTAVAGPDGRWAVKLDPLKPGEPAKLTVAGANVVELQDVLVGEVWVGGGQSNMAIGSDLGGGLHPASKSGYGARACRVAMANVYGKSVEWFGPTFRSTRVDGNKLIVSFSHVGKGLAFKHAAKLQGFAVAGEDKTFYWADAAIVGDTVVLTADKVPHPAAVRYAWSGGHPWANLFNQDGLPAQAFRSDAW